MRSPPWWHAAAFSPRWVCARVGRDPSLLPLAGPAVPKHERYKILEDICRDVIRELLSSECTFTSASRPRARSRDERARTSSAPPRDLDVVAVLLARMGLKSYRQVIWGRFPRTGIPPQFGSYDEYENFVELLVKTKSIDNGRKIWWDLRPHAFFPTIEFRVCDAATRVEETLCLAALIQAICGSSCSCARDQGFRRTYRAHPGTIGAHARGMYPTHRLRQHTECL